MGVELRERKWCEVLRIEKVGVKDYWMKKKPLHMVLQNEKKYSCKHDNNTKLISTTLPLIDICFRAKKKGSSS